MAIKTYHLNCGTLNPIGSKLVKDIFPKKIICHCVLIDIDGKLILIDTGFGMEDVNSFFRSGPLGILLGHKKKKFQTAIFQIEELGYKKEQVTDIIMTHLDLDHAGGLADFPNAIVHVHQKEYEAAMEKSIIFDSLRYRKKQFAHLPMWKFYNKGSKNWMGALDAIEIPNLGTEAYLIPLHGHTKGHCGVAIKTGNDWLLHAGDAYYVRKELDSSFKSKMLTLFQKTIHDDHQKALESRAKLNLIKKNKKVNVFSSHDTLEFEEII